MNFLVSNFFVLEVRSWSDNNLSCKSLPSEFLFSVLTRKEGPKAWPVLSHPVGQAQLAAPLARPPQPCPAVSSLKEPGAQPAGPSGSSGHSEGRPGPTECNPGTLSLCC